MAVPSDLSAKALATAEAQRAKDGGAYWTKFERSSTKTDLLRVSPLLREDVPTRSSALNSMPLVFMSAFSFDGIDGGPQPSIRQSRRFAKACPEPDFRYFSKASACPFDENAR
jgi:hypothetical protein